METAQVSIDWWLDKEAVVYIYNGILLNHIKECNLAVYNNVGATRQYYAKQNKSEKDKYHMISLMWNFRNKTNEQRGEKREANQESS